MKHRSWNVKSPNDGICSVTLYREELVYDIDFITAKLAQSSSLENGEKKSYDTASGDARNSDFINRIITSALSDIRMRLAYSAISPSSRMASDEIADESECYQIAFRFGPNWIGNPSDLCNAIHDYVVHTAVASWLQAAKPDSAASYKVSAVSDMQKIINIARSVVITNPPIFRL